VCGEVLVADRRVRGQQRVCGRDECQRERHRRACSKWRARHPDYDRERRLRARVVREAPPGEPLERDPLGEIDWGAARDAIGLEASVIAEESARITTSWARDAMHAQGAVITRQIARITRLPARDAMATGTGPP
jgi:hypothetical protein